MVHFKALAGLAFLAGAEAYTKAIKNVKGNLGSDRIIRLPYESATAEVHNLLDGYDIDEFGNTQTGIDVRLSRAAISALEQ
eukprot:CAMPEP_0204891398 /NCGR_PEP_ID=MMETSP1349-20130617/27159_1 /ASSEMBLY_ACC=CAM_ASM_000710 /TAXON_ID=215587 /ORGANISM="Aplanochytrium stocchinoi, Strain GSBS06" /LENGTH=80 /DNA_ID=CAMNT_0052056743 /DNA_START=122 /DNA_END=361 /DNA_ORIENTATION=-